MTIDQAIEELDKQLGPKYSTSGSPWHNAMKLGIEALKFIKEHRIEWHCDYPLKLPGETKD